MEIWELKFANFYQEVYAWGQAFSLVKHFLVKFGKFGAA